MYINDHDPTDKAGAYETGETASVPADAGQEENNAKNTAGDEFEQLIKGKFAGEFARRTQKIIDKRFKETKALESENARYSEFMKKLSEAVGADAGDSDALLEAALNAVRNSRAAPPDREKAEREAKAVYPDFDLSEAMKNGEFQKYVDIGLSFADAYTLSHIEEIKNAAARQGAVEAVRSIGTMRSRQPEMSREFRTEIKKSAADLSPREIRSYAERAANGERIAFSELGLK